MLDIQLKMTVLVQKAVKVCYLNIRRIWSIRKYLTTNATRTLVQALVTSHLDYNNSLLYGISEGLLDKIQKVQNAAARVILKLKKTDHITGALKRLHWLPVRYRIKYKIAVITYNTLYGNGPLYLRNLLHIRESERGLRSGNKFML